MSKIILHVGTHKTGTTTVQDSFAINRAFLLEKGLVFPQIGRANGQHGLVVDWIDLPQIYHLNISSRDAWKKISKDYSRSDQTVLISTEELSRGNPASRVDMKELRDLLCDFDEVKIICCLRNQVSFLQSIYLQVVKSGINIHWKNFFNRAINSKMATGLFLDYNDLRSYFEMGFAKDEIVFFSYEQAVQEKHGIIGRIMTECSLGHHAEYLENLSAGHSNVSPDPLGTWIAANIMRPKPYRPWLLEATMKALHDTDARTMKTTIFTKEEYIKLKKTFGPLNKKFNDSEYGGERGLKIGDFPEEEGIFFRESLNFDYWINLTHRLASEIQKDG